MTESGISLYNGRRCRICTGCGRCPEQRRLSVVSTFRLSRGSSRSLPQTAAGYLICADIGTTTVAMQLRRMADGAVLKTFTCENPQRSYGADVLSRVLAAEDPVKRAALKHGIREALAEGVHLFRQRLSDSDTQVISFVPGRREIRMVITGNTTMLHLFMGYDTGGMGKYPFTPYTLSEVRTRFLGLDTLLMPGISAFVGADITAGLLALSMQEEEAPVLLLDLGTNGEMVLGNRNRLLSTATAAGPAFEGGADYFGTDLVAVCAALRQEGLLDETGLLAEPGFTEGIPAGGVLVRQQDIRSLQLAKAAVAAGIKILCRRYGLADPGQIRQVYLAGGMGYYLNPADAVAVGLIPSALQDRTQAVGNAALEGAFLYGMGQRPDMSVVDCFNLAGEPGFEQAYLAELELMPS